VGGGESQRRASRFTAFNVPPSHRRRVRTTNLVERLNEEIRRRTRVARLSPSEVSWLRLVTALVMVIGEDRRTADKRYLLSNLHQSTSNQRMAEFTEEMLLNPVIDQEPDRYSRPHLHVSLVAPSSNPSSSRMKALSKCADLLVTPHWSLAVTVAASLSRGRLTRDRLT
jgi:hypothetical protein